jgi:hypothetical protein
MTPPTTAHGNKAVVKLDNYAGSLTAITAYENTASFDISVDTDADNNYGQRADDVTVGLTENGSVPLGGVYSSAKLRHMSGIWASAAGTSKTLELNPGSAATGTRKGTVETHIASLEMTSDLNGTSQLNTEHKLTGAITWSDN